jgi:hypothetical protein
MRDMMPACVVFASEHDAVQWAWLFLTMHYTLVEFQGQYRAWEHASLGRVHDGSLL